MNMNAMSQSQSAMSSVIIRLQNLAWEARSHDIRQFFGGLIIPDGGVHIIGGPDGDAFIAFQSDEDARKAMLRNGHSLCGNQVRLMLSSKSEMYNIIAQAKVSNPYSVALAMTSQPQTAAPDQSPQQSIASGGSPLPHWLRESDNQTTESKSSVVPTCIASTASGGVTTLSGNAASGGAPAEPRKLTVSEVQEKLSAMLSARASGQGVSTKDDECPSGNSNENERVALNFAKQLFSLLEMSTPTSSSGSVASTHPVNVAAASTPDQSKQGTTIKDDTSSASSNQLKQYTIPGLGNPSEIQHTQIYQPATTAGTFNNLKFDQHHQIPSALSTNAPFPVGPPPHLAPFAPTGMPVIPPPPSAQHSFDMSAAIPAPPTMIRPQSDSAQQYQRTGSYMNDHHMISSLGHSNATTTDQQQCPPPFAVPQINTLVTSADSSQSTRMYPPVDSTTYSSFQPIDPCAQRITSASPADITEPFLKLSNLSDVQTYKIVRQLFHPVVKLRLRDLKLINDPQGQRTGCALISLPSVDDARAALRIAVERSQGSVGVHVCTEYDFVCAVDSYMSSAMRKRNSDGFHAMRVIGFPSKWDKRDLRRFFDGVNFHSRDKVLILETDSRNPLHNIAVALLSSQLDMERAMFYDGEETGHGRISVSAITKEQVDLETSSARYRQQHRDRSSANPTSSSSRASSSTPYESRSRRADDDKSYSSRDRTSGVVSPHETKRFRPEDDQAPDANSSTEGLTVRLSGFPVLYTENDMRSLLIRAQLIPNPSEPSAYPAPEVVCVRDKAGSRLTGEVLVKFQDSALCKRALTRAKNVLAGKSIEAEILGPNRQTILVKRSRGGDREEPYRQPSTSYEHHDNRFRTAEAIGRTDFDDRRRPGASPVDYRSASKAPVESKHRPSRREGERREGPSRFDTPANETHPTEPAVKPPAEYVPPGTDGNGRDMNVVPSHYEGVAHPAAAAHMNPPAQEYPPVPQHMQNAQQVQMSKRPLLPDPVLMADNERNRSNPPPPPMPNRHVPQQMHAPPAGPPNMPPPYPEGYPTNRPPPAMPQMRPNMMPMARPPLNLPPIPAELVHLKGQIMLLDNVPYRATKEDICGWLAKFKPIESTLKIRHDDSGRPTGHAIVAMETRQDAEAACAMLRGTQLLGRLIQTMLM